MEQADEDEITSVVTLYGDQLMSAVGRQRGEDGDFSDEDTAWLLDKAEEPGFLAWAYSIIDRPTVPDEAS
jgi:hypothetical protein